MERIGRYRVVRPLGHGGMGDVFLAHDPTLERDVAIKLLHHEPSRTGVRDEARALAALNHPGIVMVFEIGEHEGQDFIAMEYLPGRALREVLAEHGATRAELISICARVARALEAAHAAEILHRDIKPENVVVAADGAIKVVDFGLARRLEHDDRKAARARTANDVVEVLRRTLPPETMADGVDTVVSAGTQTMFGTPAYMAPEVLLGEPSTPAADTYSLGIMLYECLTGHRPYSATSLIEVIAQTIEGPPPALDDPLGPLVDRMLARDPANRPSLAEIQRALTRIATVPAPPRPRRWPWLLVAIAATGLVGAGAWFLLGRKRTSAPVTASVAIAPFSVELQSYGVEPANPAAVSDVVSRLVGEVSGAHLLSTTTDRDASGVDAMFVVRGAIVTEADTQLQATLEITDQARHTVLSTRTLHRPARELGPLLDDVADEIARAIAPGAALDRSPTPRRAQMFVRLSTPMIEAGHFTEARPYLEQAVDADPSLFDGWYSLGLVLAWMDAPEDQILDATHHALALAPPGPRHEMVRGVAAFLTGDYTEARNILEPLETVTGPGTPDPRELYYYLGETNWHDGRHAAAFADFEKALKRDPRFKPATIHAWQYAVVHRDVSAARYYVGLAGDTLDWVEHAAGNYAALAASGSFQHALEAKLVLGQLDGPELAYKLNATDLDGASYRIAVAIAKGDMTGAKAAFATGWAAAMARDPDSVVYALDGLGEVVLAAGMTEEAQIIVSFLAAHSHEHPARNYQRYAILTAQLAHDPALLVREHAPERMRALADAIASGLDGDHAAAATKLQALIDDPTFSFDYPERAALLRELGASSDKVAAACGELVAPPIVRPAMLALRATCQQLGHPVLPVTP